MSFDRSLLPPARGEFIVVSDTHCMIDPGPALEFPSRRKQTPRVEAAYALIASFSPSLVVHLGDLVQEYPDMPSFGRAMDEAAAQIARWRLPLKQVAGNHDVGDKHDPTMPSSPVTAESLAEYHRRCGPSWYGFEHAGCRFVVVNAQLLGADLDADREQRSWLEAELAAHAGRRILLFLHLPPYLWDEREAWLGHYENIGEPARGWLLALLRRHRVEMIFSGHVHTAFYDRIDATRFVVANSTSFTRPGFCAMYASGPLPERGRDDAEKLGFYLCRIRDDRTDVHFIRTHGATELPRGDGPSTLVTRLPSGFARCRLGVTLRQALTPVAEVPLAFPAAIRERVRNDYPQDFALLELGATAVRTQASDLDDPLQRRRLGMLRADGVRVVATSLWPTSDDGEQLERWAGEVDAWEIQVAGSPWPDPVRLAAIAQTAANAGVPLALSAVASGGHVPGKQHPRLRHGYGVEELSELERRLSSAGVGVARVRCRVARGHSPWQAAQEIAAIGALPHCGVVDLLLELGEDDAADAHRVAEALFAAAASPDRQVFLEPLVDLDRSMDLSHGLLDTICNPRPAFHVARCLNTLLFAEDAPAQVERIEERGASALVLRRNGTCYALLVPGSDGSAALVERLSGTAARSATVPVHRLAEGSSWQVSAAEAAGAWSAAAAEGPALIALAQSTAITAAGGR